MSLYLIQCLPWISFKTHSLLIKFQKSFCFTVAVVNSYNHHVGGLHETCIAQFGGKVDLFSFYFTNYDFFSTFQSKLNPFLTYIPSFLP